MSSKLYCHENSFSSQQGVKALVVHHMLALLSQSEGPNFLSRPKLYAPAFTLLLETYSIDMECERHTIGGLCQRVDICGNSIIISSRE